MNEENNFQLLVESFKKIQAILKKNGIVTNDINLTKETLLMGGDIPIDSIAFVSFLTDYEKRLNRHYKSDLQLIIKDIIESNEKQNELSVQTIINYVGQQLKN